MPTTSPITNHRQSRQTDDDSTEPAAATTTRPSLLSLERTRPKRLKLVSQLDFSLSTNNNRPSPLSPLSPNCTLNNFDRPKINKNDRNIRKVRSIGGFANFAAAYPQYCESRCPAVRGDSVDGVGGACCLQQQQQQHAGQFLVEPNYATNQGPTQLLSFVYVGSQTDACDSDVIRRHGITHILNVSANCPQSQHVDEANFMRVPVNDGYADKLLPHFKLAFQFLDNVRRSNGRCLVHCLAGVSRSPTMVIAYIMQHLSMTQDEAYRYVKARRPSISPNFNFLGQLLEFERQLQQQKQQQQQQQPQSESSASIADDSDASCSEAKRQKRFCLTAASAASIVASCASSPTTVSAMSQMSFTVEQQQQQQHSSSPIESDCRSIIAATDRIATKRRQRPLSEVLLDESSTPSKSAVAASTASSAVLPQATTA